MTVFQTPDPISVSLELGVGELRLVAGGRTETIVEVKPTDPASSGDVAAAGQTRVDYASGHLVVRGPRNWRRWTPRGGRESIDVLIELPAGSSVTADLGLAAVNGTGRLGRLDLKTGMGDIRIDQAGAARIRTGFGEVGLGEVAGEADVKTGSGRVDIDSVTGPATVRNSNGDTRIGAVAGRAELRNANGSIHLGRAGSDVTAKTALGDIHIGVLSHGTTDARTACGQIDIGVRDGVAAWMDLSTTFGRVRNDLEDTGRPAAQEPTVEIRAHTPAGDISIRRVTTDTASAATS